MVLPDCHRPRERLERGRKEKEGFNGEIKGTAIFS